jgi:hypothetical protein
MDIQELSIIITTEYKSNICKLIPETLSKVDNQALFTFKDQQQFKVKLILKF